MPTATAKFGNVTRTIAGSYNVSWGTSPGQARLTVGAGFAGIGAIGTLEFIFRNQAFKLFDALVIDPSLSGGVNDAPKIDFIALDRRWKWQFRGRISGDFNLERRDGSLIRRASPRDLAARLFDALGEGGCDVSALPTSPRPRVVWDHVSPAEELNRLCADFGCVVCWSPISDRAYIAKVGVGMGPPPEVPFIARSDAAVWPVPPDGVEVVGGPVLFQSALALGEAVGRDVDGSYKPIDQLSYKPAAGWSIDPHGFINLDTEYTDPATGTTLYHRDLAKASVWRCYRISGQAAGGFSPALLAGGPNASTSIKDIGPFTGNLLDKDSATDERLPCYVRGTFAADRMASENTIPNTRFSGGFTIDNEQRIVTFDRPLFKYDGNGRPAPADVVLIAAYQCSKDGVPVRHTRAVPTGFTNGAGNLIEHHDEIVREVIEASASSYGGARDNLAKVSAEMGYYLDAIKTQFAEATASQVTYGGFIMDRWIALSGRLRSVTYSFSTRDAPKTMASWNSELSCFVVPWEKRLESRVRRQADYSICRANAQAKISASREAARKPTE